MEKLKNNRTDLKLGTRYIMSYALLGAFIAFVMMSYIDGSNDISRTFRWIFDFSPSIYFGLFGLVIGSLIVGPIAGKSISKGRDHIIVGIVSAITVKWISILTASLYLTLNSIYNGDTYSIAIIDYLFKPFFWITLFGFVPAFILGVLAGSHLKRKLT